ncbi:MAG: YbhB/YbcL family Raf kinase inhibitor-like protein [SAR324 cluster bacterium]|nr:YbhB/YbcL family Raf kinase inhibitor-like protein [SAR324 cluster bacterium]
MTIEISAFANGATIPGENAFCVPADEGHVAMAPNRNPAVRWSNAPAGTKSFALIVCDPDVPSVGDDVNQEGKTVSRDLPRVDFYHWVLVDISASCNEIPEGADSDGITARGKDVGKTEYGVRGINDYTGWFQGDPDMGGDYGGYDGPCPPWNDELLHHYHFKVYALDVETLGLSGSFGGAAAVKAMEGHVLADAEWIGTYTLNPDVK